MYAMKTFYGLELGCIQTNVTKLTWFSFWRTDQWASKASSL